MSVVAIIDIGLGQIAMLLMLVLMIRAFFQPPNVRAMLEGSASEKDVQELLKYALRLLALLICTMMVGYIAQCEKDGTLHSFISALRRWW